MTSSGRFSNRDRGPGGGRGRGGGCNRHGSDQDSRQCTYYGKSNYNVDTCRTKHGKLEGTHRLVIANAAVFEEECLKCVLWRHESIYPNWG